jgi:hypothetical protein
MVTSVYHAPCNMNAFCPSPESKPIQCHLIMCFILEVIHVDARYDGVEFERNSTNFAGRCDYSSTSSIREQHYDECILNQFWYSGSNFQSRISTYYIVVIADFSKKNDHES